MLTAFCDDCAWMDDVIVVDLGHCANETTGILLPGMAKGIDVSFGESVRRTKETILTASKPPLIIVEAVLSCSYDASGNPTHRGPFERRRTWWVQAGATVALAAQRFVTQINGVAADHPSFIVEAYLSEKSSKTGNAADAERIHSMWQQAEVVEPGAEWIPWTGIEGGAPQVRIIPNAP